MGRFDGNIVIRYTSTYGINVDHKGIYNTS